MGWEFPIDGDFTPLDRGLAEREARIEQIEAKTKHAGEKIEEVAQKSYNEVMGMMRASYMMIEGFSQAMGGNMNRVFAAMYSTAISAIMTWQSIAAAMAASGVGTMQAAIMTTSLAISIGNLVGLLTGQQDLTRGLRGLNMSLHGISMMMSTYSL